MDRQYAQEGGRSLSVGQRMYQAFDRMSPVDAPTVTSDIPGQMGRQGPGIPPVRAPNAHPLEDNPLFQAGYQQAQAAAVNATMRGEDPYQAALEAAHQGVRQAAQPDPNQPGGGNLAKVQQHLMQLHPELSPDRALAIAHQALPQLAQSGGGG